MTWARSTPALARRLAAPEPEWDRSADVVVVGSGVAGLTAALGVAQTGARVLLLSKGRLDDGSTCRAQGGVAAALAPGDSPERHLRDTLEAGADLCDEDAVRTLVEGGPRAFSRLVQRGAAFDTCARTGGPQRYAFTREGGHSLPRVVHAGGDATGREVQRALESAVAAATGIAVLEHAFASDLLCGASGAVAGLAVGLLGPEGEVASMGTARAPAVVLATGGFGQLFETTSNPPGATGDGLALALRAGAQAVDLEFVQFHPTVLFSRAAGGRLLISEALRGEGATLVDATGARVMAGVHPREDLAPRDVVSHAIARRMAVAPGGVRDHVYLDARGLGAETLELRFPTIVAGCRATGLDPATEPIPVAPAAHYACGGLRAGVSGRTSVSGLYAVGEVACTGVHGANRLASNSLLEGLVMGELAARDLTRSPPRSAERPIAAPAARSTAPAGLSPTAVRGDVAAIMSRYAGVLRDADGLATAATLLDRLDPVASPDRTHGPAPSRAAWEATNLHTLATVLVAAARARTESRGCHVRLDHPEPRPDWAHHVLSSVDAGGALRQHRTPTTRLSHSEAAA